MAVVVWLTDALGRQVGTWRTASAEAPPPDVHALIWCGPYGTYSWHCFDLTHGKHSDSADLVRTLAWRNDAGDIREGVGSADNVADAMAQASVAMRQACAHSHPSSGASWAVGL